MRMHSDRGQRITSEKFERTKKVIHSTWRVRALIQKNERIGIVKYRVLSVNVLKIINHEILHSFTNRMDSTVSYSLCNTIRQKHSLSCFSIYNIRIGNVHWSICKPVLGIVWYHREFEQKRRSYCTYIVRYMACHHAHRVRDRFLTRSSRQNLLIRL